MLTDIEIASSAKMENIAIVAERMGLNRNHLEMYGEFKAKVKPEAINPKSAKLVLVTAINPTPAGEGKTTVSVGLADALNRIGKKAVLALREPSLGPVFGVKGGAAGGGYAQVVPMEDINLHFTGDLHAITTANNLLAALVDNHIYQGNSLGIDPRRVTWRRCLDMNDRQLRSIVSGLEGKSNGMPREDGFDITAASEIMATLCLSADIADLKARLSRIVVGYGFNGGVITCADLKAEGALTVLLKDAIKPNLVQTLEGTPAFIHGGPFANIAHGCNSVMATKAAMTYGEYAVTEAGFGADLGAEKFLDIKCRMAGLNPSAVVIVATIRALKSHGGVKKEDLSRPDLDALDKGLPNLLKHIENITKVFSLPAVVAVNRFASDTPEEIELIKRRCEEQGSVAVMCDVWANGGKGGEELARAVALECEKPEQKLSFSYPLNVPLKKKIETVAKRIYGAEKVNFAPGTLTELKKFDAMGEFPVCFAKTQYSLSDDPKKVGRPEGFELSVRKVKLSGGAGFVVVFTGEIIAMPGLPPVPAAGSIDMDESGRITGLF